MKFKNDAGRSMMEMILYLGLIVVLSAATVKMYADSVEKTRVVKLENQIEDLRDWVNTYSLGRSLPKNEGEWTDFKNVVGGDTKFVNPWGGSVIMTTHPVVSSDPVFKKASFGISYSQLVPEKCIKIANTLWGKGAIGLNISETVITGLDVNLGKITELCTNRAVSSDSDNTVPVGVNENNRDVTGYFYKD